MIKEVANGITPEGRQMHLQGTAADIPYLDGIEGAGEGSVFLAVDTSRVFVKHDGNWYELGD